MALPSHARRGILSAVGVFALISLAPLGALTFASLILANRAVRNGVHGALSSTATVGAAAVGREVEGLKEVVTSYAERPSLRTAIDADVRADDQTVKQHLAELRGVRRGIVSAYFVDVKGRLTDAQRDSSRARNALRERDWFKQVVASDRSLISAVHEGETAEAMIIAVVAPLHRPDDSDALLGMVVVEYRAEAIDRLVRGLAASHPWTITVFDQQGAAIGRSPAEVRMQHDTDVPSGIAGASGIRSDDGPRGENISAYARIEATGWTLTTSVPASTAFAGLARLRYVVLLVATTLGLALCAGMVLVVFVLRSRFKTEAALRASEYRFSELVEALPIGLVVRNAEGTVSLANKEAHRLLGDDSQRLSPERLVETSQFVVAHTGDPYPSEQMPSSLASKGEYVTVEEVEVRYGGRVIPIEVRGAPIHDAEGRLTHAVAVFTDITERRRAREAVERARVEAEQANRAKNDFLSSMSHELRTPLNAILGFAQLLDMEERNEADTESIRTILKGGQHLLNLINELLAITCIEAGELPLSLEAVDLEESIEEAMELVRPLAEARNITISYRFERDGHQVIGDRQRLKQVLLNLASNAVKYNRDGGAVIVSVDASAGETVRFSIIDTGPGIPPNKLNRVFAAFDRLGAETSDVEGTGLGLALSRALVELMGGSIGVESAPGQGSTFWVELRVAEAEHPAETSTPKIEASVSRPPRTVLCIEDNVASVKLLERVLSYRPNVQMIAATQGSLGFDLARLHRPDMILLDLNLPDVQGREVLERLRSEESTETIPVVVLSADATPGQIERLMALGANDYLTKPINVQKCLEVLDELLGHESV